MLRSAAITFMAPGKDGKYDFFVSRRGSAATVAQEVADVLESAGYSSFSQDYDIGHGANFVAEIHKALKGCQHFIALLTHDYDEAPYTQAEWTNFYKAAVESNGARRFIVIRVEPCDPPGLLAGIVFADLVGVHEAHERRKRILAAAGGRSIAGPAGTRLFENVPPRDLNFTGRDERLAELHSLLMDVEKPAAITQAAIHGLGGIGKTTLAIEYVHRYAGAYSGVWWANAEQRSVLIASLAALAGRLDRRLVEEPEQDKAARFAIARLAERTGLPILLVYDNVENPQTLDGLVPSGGARVLVTTRWTDWGGRAAELKLEVLPPSKAAEFLQKRAARTDQLGAARLASALGNLPLALDHAGAYCKLTGTSFDGYRGKIDALIAKAPKGATHLDVFATFSLAIEKASSECHTAELLLGFFAYLASENIPLDLVTDEIVPAADLPEALAALASVSLIEHITVDHGAPAVTLHRLVQSAMRARLAERDEATTAIARATQRLEDAFPTDGYSEPKSWSRCAMLLPHVLVLREQKLWDRDSNRAAMFLLGSVAGYLLGRAMYNGAESLAREVLEISEKMLGREHTNFATHLTLLALALKEMDRRAEAEALLREALAIDEKKLGRQHHLTAIDLTNLASLFRDAGRYTEAEPLLREALAIDEKIFGREHLAVAIKLSNLANLLSATGRYPESELLLREALAIDQKMRGLDHAYTAIDQWSLAQLCLVANRTAEALPYAEAALAVLEQSLGAEHPSTKGCAHTYAAVLAALDRTAEAAALRAKYSLDEAPASGPAAPPTVAG
ncbi:MAG TPA: tetratricopeptide repeat protein [Xanthobacteraceae bacterium]|jgi:tetratricopeptide (TPR) repeat protein|nr:tetratricopeptide repeat protein [Xanthobacteraceae bacterium]